MLGGDTMCHSNRCDYSPFASAKVLFACLRWGVLLSALTKSLLQPHASRESLLYSANVHSEDAGRVLEIMADSMVRPEYREDEIAEIQASLEPLSAMCTERPETVLLDAVHKVGQGGKEPGSLSIALQRNFPGLTLLFLLVVRRALATLHTETFSCAHQRPAWHSHEVCHGAAAR